MQAGQIVKFREVIEPGDALARFVIVECRGDRVLVADVSGLREWSITPTFVYPMDALCEA